MDEIAEYRRELLSALVDVAEGEIVLRQAVRESAPELIPA